MDIKRITSGLLGFPLVLIVLIIGNKYIVDIALTIIAILAMDEYFNAISKISKPVKWIGYVSCISIAPIVPAIHPSMDFLGLILLNLCFPKYFPIKYANMSVPHAANITYQIKIFPFSIPFILAKNIINNTTYKMPKSV